MGRSCRIFWTGRTNRPPQTVQKCKSVAGRHREQDPFGKFSAEKIEGAEYPLELWLEKVYFRAWDTVRRTAGCHSARPARCSSTVPHSSAPWEMMLTPWASQCIRALSSKAALR